MVQVLTLASLCFSPFPRKVPNLILLATMSHRPPKPALFLNIVRTLCQVKALVKEAFGTPFEISKMIRATRSHDSLHQTLIPPKSL